MKLLLLTVFATVGLAISESEPEAKPGLAYLPYYGYYGYYPYYHYKGLGVAAHPTGTSWTQRSVQFRRKRSADAPVFPSIEGVFGTPHNSAVGTTTWGFPRVKRSAAAPVFPSIDGVFGTPHNSAVGTTTWGFPRAKRSAEANVALPPPAFGGEVFGATHNSWVGPTTWGFPSTKAKRSAEPEANPGLLHYPYFYHPVPVVYAIKPPAPEFEGVFGATHNSAVGTTTWGFPSTKAKRSAEPEANPGLFHYPYLYHPVPVVYAIKPIVHEFPASEGEGVAAYTGDATATIGSTTWGFPAE